MNRSFTEAEQSAFLLTNVDNSSSPGYSGWLSTIGSNNTQDKVFLLSYAEANKYLGVTYNDSENRKLRTVPTNACTVVQDAYTSSNQTADGESTMW